MAYNPTTGLITPPVSINDVQRALGIGGGGDVGTLIRTGNINMWSKCKPVVYPSVSALHPFVAGTGDGPLSPGIDASSIFDTPENIAYSEHVWTYIRPSGGLSQPFRLPDFGAYFIGAVCPVQIDFNVNSDTTFFVTGTVHIDDDVQGFNNSYNIRFRDFVPLSQYASWRVTMAITDQNDNVLWYYFAEEPLNGTYNIWNHVRATTLPSILTLGNTYNAVMMITDFTDEQYLDNGCSPSVMAGHHGISLGVQTGIDRSSFVYTNPAIITDVKYSCKVMEISYSSRSGDVDTYQVYGMEWWLRPINIQLTPGDLKFKMEMVYNDGYDPDDESQGGGADTRYGYKSRIVQTVVDWTVGSATDNMTWDNDKQAYVLELSNYVYQSPINGNRHDKIYLDNGASVYPSPVTFNLWLETISSGTLISQVVASQVLNIPQAQQGAYYERQNPL